MIYRYSKAYDIFRHYVKFIHRLFYKNIYIEGLNKIPDNTPIIFAPNHQNALMDPMAILLSIKQQPVFLARADIFNSPIKKAVLQFLKILPVYRVRDGLKSLGNNDITFEISCKVLETKNTLALFPEARHHGRHFLLPLKKGIPRIAFLTEAKHNFELDLKIIPAGIHYGDYYTANSDLWVRFGDPISFKDLKELHAENQQKAQLQLRDRIADGIKKEILNIEDEENYEYLVLAITIYNISAKTKGKDLLNNSKECVRQINSLSLVEREKIILNAADLHKHMEKLSLKISDLNLLHINTWQSITKIIATTPIFIAGIVPSLPHLLFSWLLYRNLKDRQFESSYKFVSFLLLSPFSNIIFSFYALPKLFDMHIFIYTGSFFALFFIESYIFNYLKTLTLLKRKLLLSSKLKILSPKIQQFKVIMKTFKNS